MEGQTSYQEFSVTTGGATVQPVVISPAPTPAQLTAQPVNNTQPQAAPAQAVNVDINAIITQAETKAAEVAEKRAEGAFKSMLQQQGLDTETINKMTAEWKSKQQTPEDIIKGKDEEISLRDGTIGQLQQQIETERQEKVALSKGVPLGAEDEAIKDKATACITLARSYMSETVPFEAALDKALAIISFKEVKLEEPSKPRIYPGTPPSQVNLTEAETLKAQFERAKSLNDSATMVRIMRTAESKKINLI